MNEVVNVVGYRLRRSLQHSRATLIGLVVVLALIGGTGLGALATARETEDSFNTLLARTNPAQLNVTVFAPNITSLLEHLSGVRHVEGSLYSMAAFPLSKAGTVEIRRGLLSGKVTPLGSIGGEFFNQDKVSVIAGRLANPRRKDEFVATAAAEKLMGWHVGQVIPMDFFDDVSSSSTSPAALTHPTERIVEHLVGTVDFYDDLAQDQVDRLPTWLLFTPPVTSPLNKGPQYIDYALQLRPGVSVGQVERELVKAVPAKVTYTVHTSASEESQVNLSVRPEALALGIFGLLVVLSALLISLQLIARELRAGRDDQEVMRALGARRFAIVLDAMAPVALACVIGSTLALVVALILSPLSPLGPVHPVLAGAFHLNGALVVPGCALLFVVAVGGGVLLAFRVVSRRRVSITSISGGSRVARLGATAGLGAAAVAGLHFAFESGRDHRGAPVRSVLAGVGLSAALLTTTLTFGAGLSTLVAHPPLYGWNWDYGLTNTGGGVPPASTKVLSASPYVAGWSPVTFGDVQINDQTIPAMLEPARAAVAPPLVSGHQVEGKDQIVLGQSTLSALHKRLGDHVTLSYGTKANAPAYVAPVRVTIVGVATLPAIGRSQELHPSMGTGAVLDSAVINKGLYDTLLENLVVSDVDMVLVRLRAGTTFGEGRAVMNHAAVTGDKVYRALPHDEGEGISMTVLPVQYPAEIINYRSIGDIPLYLSLGFALGVVVAFAVTVVSLVRRRRRDLALLKTLGFTRRQLSECIAWQASATVLTGLTVGIPVGILVGRWLWDEFARQIFAIPFATIPTVSLVVLAASALIVANVIAYVPGRRASRVAAVALRGD